MHRTPPPPHGDSSDHPLNPTPLLPLEQHCTYILCCAAAGVAACPRPILPPRRARPADLVAMRWLYYCINSVSCNKRQKRRDASNRANPNTEQREGGMCTSGAHKVRSKGTQLPPPAAPAARKTCNPSGISACRWHAAKSGPWACWPSCLHPRPPGPAAAQPAACWAPALPQLALPASQCRRPPHAHLP